MTLAEYQAQLVQAQARARAQAQAQAQAQARAHAQAKDERQTARRTKADSNGFSTVMRHRKANNPDYIHNPETGRWVKRNGTVGTRIIAQTEVHACRLHATTGAVATVREDVDRQDHQAMIERRPELADEANRTVELLTASLPAIPPQETVDALMASAHAVRKAARTELVRLLDLEKSSPGPDAPLARWNAAVSSSADRRKAALKLTAARLTLWKLASKFGPAEVEKLQQHRKMKMCHRAGQHTEPGGRSSND